MEINYNPFKFVRISVLSILEVNVQLSDSICQNIIRERIIPKLKENLIYEGIISGIEGLSYHLKNKE